MNLSQSHPSVRFWFLSDEMCLSSGSRSHGKPVASAVVLLGPMQSLRCQRWCGGQGQCSQARRGLWQPYLVLLARGLWDCAHAACWWQCAESGWQSGWLAICCPAGWCSHTSCKLARVEGNSSDAMMMRASEEACSLSVPLGLQKICTALTEIFPAGYFSILQKLYC